MELTSEILNSHREDCDWWAGLPKPTTAGDPATNQLMTKLGRAIAERGTLLQILHRLRAADVAQSVAEFEEDRKNNRLRPL